MKLRSSRTFQNDFLTLSDGELVPVTFTTSVTPPSTSLALASLGCDRTESLNNVDVEISPKCNGSMIGLNLRINADETQGGRNAMEDVSSVTYCPTSDGQDLEYIFLAIFDGHGGRSAAQHAADGLENHIRANPGFWSDNDAMICDAIKKAFWTLHNEMWTEYENWPTKKNFAISTAGTTASVAIIKKGKLYLAHVGDSSVVLGSDDPSAQCWREELLTKEHKPEDEVERAAIESRGGKLTCDTHGVERVAMQINRSGYWTLRPCLNLTRSLGDFWSYNASRRIFEVSPEPDVQVIPLNLDIHRCLIMASDGVWNVLSPEQAVQTVFYAERENARGLLNNPGIKAFGELQNWINPAERLVARALDRWHSRGMGGDNISVITVYLDPPGTTRSEVIRQHGAPMINYLISTTEQQQTDPRQEPLPAGKTKIKSRKTKSQYKRFSSGRKSSVLSSSTAARSRKVNRNRKNAEKIINEFTMALRKRNNSQEI